MIKLIDMKKHLVSKKYEAFDEDNEKNYITIIKKQIQFYLTKTSIDNFLNRIWIFLNGI